MERMSRVVVQAGPETQIKDVSVFYEQAPDLFPTAVAHCVQFSSLEQQFVTVLWFYRERVL